MPDRAAACEQRGAVGDRSVNEMTRSCHGAGVDEWTEGGAGGEFAPQDAQQ